MELTYYGQSCFGAEIDGTNLLFDPFIRPNELAEHIDVDEIEADYLLLTHGHQDHVADAEYIAEQTGATFISNFEIINWFADKGFDGHPLNHGGGANFDFGRVTFVQAIHSSVLPDGTYGGNPGGFIIETDEVDFYHAGDTALTMDMKLIPMSFEPLDFAILPIGDNFTMDVRAAILASDFIECDKIVGCHYDTFGFIEIDKEQAIQQFQDQQKNLILLDIGESTSF